MGFHFSFQRGAFQEALSTWYKANKRDLPWRKEPTVYKTIVSEFMLQQTQVETVLPYFKRWMEKFPNIEALAKSEAADVVKHWEGLGYYSRARNLHNLAKSLQELMELPKTAQQWLQFKGIGPYTAAAISSIAFGYPEAVVDGNVVRILTRLTGDDTPYKSSSAAIKPLSPLAQALLDRKDPNTHNQAMMELGATVCTKGAPLCQICPIGQFCQANKKGIQKTLPKLARAKTKAITKKRLWATKNGTLLLHQIPATANRLPNLWELPEITDDAISNTSIALKAVKKRAIGNERIEEQIYHLKKPERIEFKERTTWKWIPFNELSSLTLSGPHRLWIDTFLREESY